MIKHHPRSFLPLVALCLLASTPTLRAQTAATPGSSLLPGPKPADVPWQWKQLVGIYKDGKDVFLILERNKVLFWRVSGESKLSKEIPLSADARGVIALKRSGLDDIVLTFQKDQVGEIVGLIFGERSFLRIDAGPDPSRFYHVVPAHPLDQLRATAQAAKPPAEPGPFRNPALVELTTLDPAFHLDIRYAQSNNFLSTPIYTQARAFLQKPAAEALLRVLHKLQPLGYGLLIHDAYRPWYVTKLFWDATPPEGHIFVADPNKGSRHNRGCAVDLTLYDLVTGQPIEMPGLYDEMSSRSFPNFPGGTSLQRWHRDLLRRATESEGFTVNEDEWWHFDFKEWKQYPILNIPFEDLSVSPPRP